MQERIIRVVAGTVVLTGIALSHFVHPNWIWLSVFAGVNLFQSGITKWCLLSDILNKIGIKKTRECVNE